MNALGIVGGLVGGAVGAVVWTAAAWATGQPVGFAALGIGLAVGAGVHLASGATRASGGRRRMAGGLIAAAIATVSIVGGRIGAAYFVGEQGVLAGGGAEGFADSEFAISFLADEIVAERKAAGESIAWPAASVPAFAARAADYPPDVWEEAWTSWSALSIDERCRFRSELPGNRVTRFAALRCLVTEGVLWDVKLLDAVFLLVAIGGAFKLGSTAGS